jgi:CRP-like cAMP-binding protein
MSFAFHDDRPARPDTTVAASGNLLLGRLHSQERDVIAPLLESVVLELDDVLYEPDAEIEHVYFPDSGAISLTRASGSRVVEVGTIGREGMVGTAALLRSTSSRSRVFVQFSGLAQRMRADEFLDAIDGSSFLERLMLRYVHAFHDEVSQSVVCNRLHDINERCARWLLITRDRLGSDVLPIKQRYVAYMLGVHRPAATLALTVLQRQGLIQVSRGEIRILDNARLESASCGCDVLSRDTYAYARRQ